MKGERPVEEKHHSSSDKFEDLDSFHDKPTDNQSPRNKTPARRRRQKVKMQKVVAAAAAAAPHASALSKNSQGGGGADLNAATKT